MMKAGVLAAACAAGLVGCTTVDDGGGGTGGPLAGTTWRLAELQANGETVRPADTSRYTMELMADGSAAFQLDCNRGAGKWSSTGAGKIGFGPLAMTRAMCPPGSFDTRIAADLGDVNGYALVGDRLTLTRASGGSLVWVRPSVQPTPR